MFKIFTFTVAWSTSGTVSGVEAEGDARYSRDDLLRLCAGIVTGCETTLNPSESDGDQLLCIDGLSSFFGFGRPGDPKAVVLLLFLFFGPLNIID